jgi:hypothetical protein
MSSLSRLNHHVGYTTQTADTEITALIPPKGNNYKTKLNRMIYTAAGTVHDLVIMRALNKTTVASDAADGATTLVLTDGDDVFLGADIAANDFIVLKHTEGTYGLYKVSANTAGSLTIGALAQPVGAGQPCWIMGAPADQGHLTFKSIASTRIDIGDSISGIAESGYETVVSNTLYSRSGFGDPLMFYSANATAAGFLHLLSASYIRMPQN